MEMVLASVSRPCSRQHSPFSIMSCQAGMTRCTTQSWAVNRVFSLPSHRSESLLPAHTNSSFDVILGMEQCQPNAFGGENQVPSSIVCYAFSHYNHPLTLLEQRTRSRDDSRFTVVRQLPSLCAWQTDGTSQPLQYP